MFESSIINSLPPGPRNNCLLLTRALVSKRLGIAASGDSSPGDSESSLKIPSWGLAGQWCCDLPSQGSRGQQEVPPPPVLPWSPSLHSCLWGSAPTSPESGSVSPGGEEKEEELWVGTDGPDFTAHLYVSISYLVSLSLSFLACKMGRMRPPSEGCFSQGQCEDVEPRTLVKPTAPHPKARLRC